MKITAAHRPGIAAASLAALALVASWPGVSMYDSVWQYQQAVEGAYNDWHPPVMAHLWALLLPLGGGAAPMFVLQVALYWGGLGLLAAALARTGRAQHGVAVLATGAFPLFLGWQAAVLKDAQMAGAMLAATGLLAWWRLRVERIPWPAVAGAAVLLGYATLVRSNAVFAVLPLVAMLSPWPAGGAGKAVAALVGITAVLVVAPVVNHQLLGAVRSPVVYTQPIFDLAGIAHRVGDTPGLLPAERAMIAARHCYTPFFWDPLGDLHHCGALAVRIDAVPLPAVAADWAGAVLRHPLAYAAHRIAHLNSTDRLIVPLYWQGAAPPDASEPNDVGLGNPGRGGVLLAKAGAVAAETPLGWPIVWIVVAGTVLIAAHGPARTPVRDLAVALAVSALALEASFAVISIASDLRYHLWPMIASALAAVLIAGSPLPRRAWIGGVALALVVTAGLAARALLPLPPIGYSAMLG